ncbi:uncharacterized protein LOC111626630 [Centruroides sculpturatus]|uniref:uncharacterized protein LOC111626630 n=1 Tax=Centruroides sculpturatus TaxID=218467 RepID=UPI000C6D6110|nr:uncharacterized protein LOC111626630 [Centruroides sculpturatus]XP_023225853.1 uncharacterized protein LOC111626630 [Centruroides sculpturatus]XP_023225863.1 uncharacterized protein LOC111626630 [Centruroides sculpturatus]XP_023225870.1 uncharacterized protein LOC111626630 [Centruroides sculpturatus]
MDAKYVDIDSVIDSNKKKLLKISNTLVSLESKYLNAKKTIKRTIRAIKQELISELDVAYQTKHQSLLDFQRKVKEYISSLSNVCNTSQHYRDVLRIVEKSPAEVRLLPYISLDFIPEDISIAKSAIGYLKTCAVSPEELTFTVSELDNKYWVEVKSSKPWHSLLIHSLTAFAENFAGRKFYGNVIDRKDGLYSITFRNFIGIDFKVSVLLYGRHVRNSPLTIKAPPFICEKCVFCPLRNAHVDTSTPKTVEIPNRNESTPKLLSGDGICSSFGTENDEKQSFKVTGMGHSLVEKEEIPKRFLDTTGKHYSPEEWSKEENIYPTEGLNMCSVENSEVDQNKSNKTVSVIKENTPVNSSYVNEFCTERKEKRNSSSVTKEVLMSTNNNSSFLTSEWSESISADRMDNSKISSTGGDRFWSPQTTENLNGTMKDASVCVHKTSNYTEDDDEEKIVPVTAKLTHVISKQCGVDLRYPIGVAVNNNEDIVICDTGNHRVWIVDKTGKRKALFNSTRHGKRLCRPSAVVMFQNGDLVIKDDNSLHFYDSNGMFIKTADNKMLSRPFGLVLTEDKKLVTLSESRQPKLFSFNMDGQLEYKSFYQPLLNRPENSKCRFMATYNNELVVSDLGLSKMYKTNLLGEEIQIFGSYGKTPGNFNEPSGITLDSSGTMLIGDSKNDRIQIFDWDGEYLGEVQFSDPIRRPSDITLTPDGYLYVLNYLDHFLGVYKLEMDE